MGIFDGYHTANIHTMSTTEGVGTQGPPGVGFKQTSSGDYDLQNKIMFNVKTQNDVSDDSDYDSIKKDYGSAVNKEYLRNNFLKRNKTNVYFDLRGYSIQNSEVYDPDSWNDKTITNKEYVDLRDNLKADKTELNKKADLETSDEQTFKGIINVPDFDSGYSNMSNVMNKKYVDQKVDKNVSAPQRLKSRLQVPDYNDSSHSSADVVNVKYVNDFFLNKKTGGSLDNSITFNLANDQQ